MADIIHVQTIMLREELDELKRLTGTPVTKDAVYEAVEHYCMRGQRGQAEIKVTCDKVMFPEELCSLKNIHIRKRVRAPSMFMSSLKRKAENAGGYLIEFSTQTTKLSQTCHICEEAKKKPLSQRWHVCCGIETQRDLYSAYLAKCVDAETGVLDIARARQLWQGLEPVLSAAVSRARQTAIGGRNPASFGFGSQSQSGSLVKPVTIISEAMDAVILMDESRRELI